MPRLMLVELAAEDMAWLGWAAGAAAAQGNMEAASSLGGIIGRVQTIEYPDDDLGIAYIEDNVPTPEPEAEPEVPDAPDPMFTPPPVMPPINNQDDFGAGRPPRL